MEEKYLIELFDNDLKNYLLLEKTIYESVEMYKENPNDQMKYLIDKLCNYGKRECNKINRTMFGNKFVMDGFGFSYIR